MGFAFGSFFGRLGQSSSAVVNSIINGGLEFWQRDTSFSGNLSNYTADRIYCWGGNTEWSVSKEADTILPTGCYGSFGRQEGATDTTEQSIGYSMEEADVTILRDKDLILSFDVATASGWSPSSGTLNLEILSDSSEKRVSNLSNTITSDSWNLSQDLSWVSKSASFTMPSNAKGFGIKLSWTPSGTASSDALHLSKIMLVEGSSELPFARSGRNIQDELSYCERYYESGCISIRDGGRSADTQRGVTVKFNTPKRDTPVVTLSQEYTSDGWGNYGSGEHRANTEKEFHVNVTAQSAIPDGGLIDFSWTASSEI